MKKNKRYSKGNILYDLVIIFVILLAYFRFNQRQEYIIYFIAFIVAFVCIIMLCKIITKERYKKKLLSSGLLEIDQMDGVTFEYFLFFVFQKLGYKVSTTSKSHDYGADLILKKDGVVFVCQAKRKRDKVGINAVQEVLGARYYYKADKAFVMTNSFYTKSAVNLANTADVKLLNRSDLIEKMNEINGKKIVEEYKKI